MGIEPLGDPVWHSKGVKASAIDNGAITIGFFIG